MNNLLKLCIFGKFLLIEALVQGALQKELVFTPFVKHLKTGTLGKSTDTLFQYLELFTEALHFC